MGRAGGVCLLWRHVQPVCRLLAVGGLFWHLYLSEEFFFFLEPLVSLCTYVLGCFAGTPLLCHSSGKSIRRRKKEKKGTKRNKKEQKGTKRKNEKGKREGECRTPTATGCISTLPTSPGRGYIYFLLFWFWYFGLYGPCACTDDGSALPCLGSVVWLCAYPAYLPATADMVAVARLAEDVVGKALNAVRLCIFYFIFLFIFFFSSLNFKF